MLLMIPAPTCALVCETKASAATCSPGTSGAVPTMLPITVISNVV
jgi:hypothetical protein